MKDAMIHYEIWQLPLADPHKFKHTGWFDISELSIKNYVMVYGGDTELKPILWDTLEDIFYMFNQECPEDYYASVMSVSDVICLVTRNSRTWYYVDGVGFKKLEWNV